MTQPGMLGNAVPPGADYIMRRIAQLEREIAAERTARAQQDLSTSALKPKFVQIIGRDFNLTANDFDTLQAQQTMVFPDGWRACVLSMQFAVGAWNNNGSADTLAGSLMIAGGTGWPTFTEVDPSRYGAVTAVQSTIVYRDTAAENALTALGWPLSSLYADTDGTFVVGGNAYTGANTWTHIASPTNLANLSGTALFIR